MEVLGPVLYADFRSPVFSFWSNSEQAVAGPQPGLESVRAVRALLQVKERGVELDKIQEDVLPPRDPVLLYVGSR